MIAQKKIMLLSPPSLTHRTPEENLGLEYLAAELLDKGHTVNYLDAYMQRLTDNETVNEIIKYVPDVLGMSPSMDSFLNCQEIIKGIKKRGFTGIIVMGGVYASFESNKLLLAFPGNPDIILRGETDSTFLGLIEGKPFESLPGAIYLKNGGIVANPISFTPVSLNSLPLPVRPTFSLVRKYKTPSHVMGSRGCYGNCSFCSVSSFQKFSSSEKWRGRDPKSLVSELKKLSEKGETMVKFIDDNFFGGGNKEREKEFAKLLINSGIKIRFRLSLRVDDVDKDTISLLKKAGLFAVSIGVESFVQRKLNDFGKGTTVKQNMKALNILKANNVFVQMGHIMFDPYIKIDEIKKELYYLDVYSWAVTKGICTKLFAAEGTKITEKIRGEIGFVGKEGTNNNYDIVDPGARAFYEACRLWARNNSFLYDMAIDPISAPKNISHKELVKFHKICVELKKYDFIVAGRLLEEIDSSSGRELKDTISSALVEYSSVLESVRRKIDNLYRDNGLTKPFIINARI